MIRNSKQFRWFNNRYSKKGSLTPYLKDIEVKVGCVVSIEQRSNTKTVGNVDLTKLSLLYIIGYHTFLCHIINMYICIIVNNGIFTYLQLSVLEI